MISLDILASQNLYNELYVIEHVASGLLSYKEMYTCALKDKVLSDIAPSNLLIFIVTLVFCILLKNIRWHFSPLTFIE